MRAYLATATLALAALGCGGDSNDPSPTFPDAAGVYNVSGTFDEFLSTDAHFEGTLTLTQAHGSRAPSAAVRRTW